jgi:hypothetical protein
VAPLCALHAEPNPAKQATPTTSRLPSPGYVGQHARTHQLLSLQQSIGNQAVLQMLHDRHGATIQRVITRISGKNIDLATAQPSDIQEQIKQLVERQDDGQLQILRGALTVQIQENNQKKVDSKVIQGLLELIDSVKIDKSPVDIVQITPAPLNSTDIRTEFTTRLRDGVQLVMSYHGFTNEGAILKLAFEPAARAYIQFCQQSPYAKLLPNIEEITSQEAIIQHYERLRKEQAIVSSDVDEHLKEHSAKFENSEAKAKYIQDQHERARSKAAGTWAEIAQAYFSVYSKLSTLSQTEVEEGRGSAGRLAYMLMTVSAKDLFEGLVGGTDIKEGVKERTGVVKLVQDIADVFSSAACHKDAEQMMLLMAGRLFVKGEAALKGPDDVPPLLMTIMSALGSCPGERCVLKLTNEQNHSAVYLVGEQTKDKQATRGGARYHTIAGQDSEDILYNQLVESTTHIRELGQLVKNGLDTIAKAYMGPATLKWEVHTATDLKTMFNRVDTRLREGESALSVGLGVAEFERRGRDKMLGNLVKETDSVFLLPVDEIEAATHAQVHLLRFARPLKIGDLKIGEEYRVFYRGRWIKARFMGLRKDVPKWSGTAAAFLILDTGEKFAKPDEPLKADSSKGEENVRFVDIIRSMGHVEGPRNLGWWVWDDLNGKQYKAEGGVYVLKDPLGPAGGQDRWMIAKKI